MKTLYDVLGLKEDATTDEVRAGFRRLAKRFHPDVNKDPQAAEVMKILTQAYEVLSDERWRAEYDQKLARLRAPKPQPQQIVVRVFGHQGFGGFGFSNNASTANSTTSGMGGVFFTEF
jgi:molecular chaperone DnaJ